MHLQDQIGEAERLFVDPGILDQVGEQNMLAGAQRVNVIHAHQPQEGGDGTGDAFAQAFTVFFPIQIWGRERRKDIYRDA
ncbi:hypothetical protein SDC9_145974 [bioreactor metagenome]|uniref:Uncharacterized protein n=1 Tax=bioreactor metagenome TaxID=1076179 RepID=A0A645E9V0_9ZZZZ